ncbi:hypothetical protein EV175_006276 [Coemansia sp. RSA 1933]|nr:hypothetical protein EV175_006276 [Coemansia sp. RSA 1933]
MDTFTASVKQQEVQLDGADKVCAATYISYYYWYRNVDKQAQDTFMSAGTMEKAFYVALCDFPLFAGNLISDCDGQMFVRVETDDLNMPVYSDTACDVDFDTVKDSGFDTKLLGNKFIHARHIPVPYSHIGGRIKSLEAHIVRLKDFSGVCLLVSIAHFIVDGYGHSLFVRRWAEATQWLMASNTESGSILCERQYIHDRSFLSQFWDSGTDRLDDLACKIMTRSSAVSRWAAWLSPETRGRLLKFQTLHEKRVNSYFRIPKKDIEALRAVIQENSVDGMRFSNNDVLTTIVTRVLVQSKQAADNDRQERWIPSALRSLFGKKEEPMEAVLALAVNLRPRTNRQDVYAYTGTMALTICTSVPLRLIETDPEPKTLAGIAANIRETVSRADAKCIGQHLNLLNRESDGYLRKLAGLPGCKYVVVVSNLAGFDHYDVDFGTGIPTLVRPALLSFTNSIHIMPCRQGDDAYEIAMTLTADIANKVIQNTFWMGLVDGHSHDV